MTMPRPRICRRVGLQPNVTYFKPAGIRVIDLDEAILAVEEFEAVRLKDLLGFEQEKCAKMMGISQPTFHRLVASARKKIADAVVNGKAIRIEGGSFKFARPGSGGTARGAAAAAARAEKCVCPKCGHRQQKIRGVPCAGMECPECGTRLVRRD